MYVSANFAEENLIHESLTFNTAPKILMVKSWPNGDVAPGITSLK